MNALRLMLVGFALCLCCLSCSSRSITEDEKGLLFKVDDLSGFNISTVRNDSSETFEFTNYGLGMYDIEYTYDSPDVENATPLYLSSKLEFGDSEQDARSNFGTEVTGLKVVWKATGYKFVERPELFRRQGMTYCAIIEYDGSPVGNLLVQQMKKKVFSLVLIGIYFDKAEKFEELLTPKLDMIEAYKNEA